MVIASTALLAVWATFDVAVGVRNSDMPASCPMKTYLIVAGSCKLIGAAVLAFAIYKSRRADVLALRRASDDEELELSTASETANPVDRGDHWCCGAHTLLGVDNGVYLVSIISLLGAVGVMLAGEHCFDSDGKDFIAKLGFFVNVFAAIGASVMVWCDQRHTVGGRPIEHAADTVVVVQ